MLAGSKSQSESVLDSKGNIIETVNKYEGSKGKDLVLSVDVEFQKAVEEILKKTSNKVNNMLVQIYLTAHSLLPWIHIPEKSLH